MLRMGCILDGHMTRICIIGAGNHSRSNHGPSLKQLHSERPDEIKLAAVCDLDEDKAASYASDYKFERTYQDFRVMIEKEHPDAVIAVTAIDRTADIVKQLLPYGIPLELEKPPGRTLEEAHELYAAVKESGTPHMISFNRRFNPALTAAADGLNESGYRVEHVIARMLRNRRRERTFVLGTGVHLIDSTLSFLSGCESVESRRWETTDGGQHAAVVLRSTSGQSAHLEILPDSGFTQETYELVGSGFRAFVDTGDGKAFLAANGETMLNNDFGSAEPHVSGGAYAETKAFIDSVRQGGPFTPTMEDGLLAMKVADAIERGGSHILEQLR